SMPSDLIRGWTPVRRQGYAPTRRPSAHLDPGVAAGPAARERLPVAEDAHRLLLRLVSLNDAFRRDQRLDPGAQIVDLGEIRLGQFCVRQMIVELGDDTRGRSLALDGGAARHRGRGDQAAQGNADKKRAHGWSPGQSSTDIGRTGPVVGSWWRRA